MLCQLVCIDRRYQRMNCFNIREIQTLLRSKYHPSFLDILEHHQFLEYTTIGLRFKLFNLDSIGSNMLLSYEHFLNKNSTERNIFYSNFYLNSYENLHKNFLQIFFTETYNFLNIYTKNLLNINYNLNDSLNGIN